MSAPITKTDRHLSNLDALRALAVMSVFTHHAYVFLGFPFPLFDLLGGLIGVQLFFIISGYLISESASKHSFKAYWLHRFFRIFPIYWIAYLGFSFVAEPVTPARIAEDPISFILNLLNLQQLWAPALIDFSTLHVTWTLTIELFWYILAPALVLLLSRQAFLYLGGALIISTAWIYLAKQGELTFLFQPGIDALSPEAANSPHLPNQLLLIINRAFPSCLIFFAMGACIYRYRDAVIKINTTFLIIIAIIFVLLLGNYIQRFPDFFFLSGIGVSTLFIIALKAPPLDSKLIIRIGKISYSIYLVHFPIIVLCHPMLKSLGVSLTTLATFLITYAVANITYELVERPSMRLARKLSQLPR